MDTPSRLELPRQIGPYRTIRLIGRGGAGTVFEARREPDGRLVALKLLAPDVARDPELQARVRREMRALAKLDHPGIVRVVDAGEVAGQPFLALELLSGGTLADRVRERGRVPWPEGLELGAQVAAALAHVHAAGLVHRDVKPANVFLDASGRTRLGDFGLVRPAPDSTKGLTRSGEALGTPEFLAPEQVDRAHAADSRADLYSLGATLYVLLTGAPPFAGLSGAALLFAKLQKSPASPRARVAEIPEPVAAIVLRLLEREPGARGADAATVGRELEALARTGGGVRVAPRSRALALGVVGVVALIGVGIVAVRARAIKAPPAVLPTSTPSPTPRPTPTPSPTPTPTPTPLSAKAIDEANDTVSYQNLRMTGNSIDPKLGAEIEALLEGVAATASVHEALGRLHLKLMTGRPAADVAAKRADVERARIEFEKAIDLAPDFGEAHLGVARVKSTRFADETLSPAVLEQALAESEKAARLNPELGEAWRVSSDLLHVLRRDEEAFDALYSGIARAKEPDELYAPLAKLAANTGRYADAEDAALKAAVAESKANKKDKEGAALEVLARARLELGKWDKALEAAEDALTKVPSSASAHLYYGRALWHCGRHDDGLAEIERSLTLMTAETQDTVVHAGLAFIECGQLDRARQIVADLRAREARGTVGNFGWGAGVIEQRLKQAAGQ